MLHATLTPVAKIEPPFPEASRRFHNVAFPRGRRGPETTERTTVQISQSATISYYVNVACFLLRYFLPHAGISGGSISWFLTIRPQIRSERLEIALEFPWQACESLHATPTPVAKIEPPFPEASRRIHTFAPPPLSSPKPTNL